MCTPSATENGMSDRAHWRHGMGTVMPGWVFSGKKFSRGPHALPDATSLRRDVGILPCGLFHPVFSWLTAVP